jgi:threonyl-tRNA synthetase
LLTVGPSTKDGFFYDFYSPSGRVVAESDYATLEKHIKAIIKARHKFERLVISKEEALDLFSYNNFKTYLIENKVPSGALTSVYKIGDFIDLCTGPHIENTGLAKGFSITKHSASYWLGDAKSHHL